MANNKPIETIRHEGLKATIWDNSSDEGPFFTATLSRTFKDKDGNYKDSNSYSPSNLLVASHIAQKAFDRIDDRTHPW